MTHGPISCTKFLVRVSRTRNLDRLPSALEESGQLAYLGGPACDMLWRHNSAHKDAMLLPNGGISSAANWIKVKFHTLWYSDSVVKFVMSR